MTFLTLRSSVTFSGRLSLDEYNPQPFEFHTLCEIPKWNVRKKYGKAHRQNPVRIQDLKKSIENQNFWGGTGT